MVFLRALILTIGILIPSFFSSQEKNDYVRCFYTKGYRWNYQKHIKEQQQDINRYVDWSNLYYYSSNYKKLVINSGDNFISKGEDTLISMQDSYRKFIYEDLLKIYIDSSINMHSLIYPSTRLYRDLIGKIYDNRFFDLLSDRWEYVMAKYKLPFTGSHGLIKFILSSYHYFPQQKITTIQSPYTANRYNKIIIDVRGFNFFPNLFPKIYSFDKQGNKKLIYSIENSVWDDVIKNGYVHYYSTEKNLVKDKHAFYISAVDITGNDKDGDVIISRNDYLKFFTSRSGVMNLSKGAFEIVMDKPLPSK